MATTIKKASFDELQNTLSVMGNKIDTLLQKAKQGKRGKKIWDGFKTYKDFLKHIESVATKEIASELSMGESTIRERWKALTLPDPVYFALEKDEISFSKIKPLTAINFDFEDPNDVKVAQEIVDEIKKNISLEEIKELVKTKAKSIWHSKDIVMERFAEQNGINDKTVC